jgi:urea transporter
MDHDILMLLLGLLAIAAPLALVGWLVVHGGRRSRR